jgi:hypothetical protein
MRGAMIQNSVFAVLFFLLLSLAVLWTTPGFGESKRPGNVQRRVLQIVGPGVGDQPIVVSSGDMLEIIPFTYPVVPKFLGAKLVIQLDGDRTIEEIGQAGGVTGADGRTGTGVFFLARETGRVQVRISLVKDDLPISGFGSMSYVIDVRQ